MQLTEIIESVGTDTSKKWVSVENVNAIMAVAINQCIEIMQVAGKQCAGTTYDLSIVDCTIEKSINSIKQHFNI